MAEVKPTAIEKAAAKIVALTEWCGASLTQLTRDPKDPEQQSWAEVQSQRLNLWAKTLGVFAEGNYSIAYRLSSNKQVTGVIVQLLTALSGNLRLYYNTSGKPPVANQPKDYSDSESDTDTTSDEDGTSDEDPEVVLKQHAKRIQDGLGRLGQLAVMLRRDGAERAEAAALTYQPFDPKDKTKTPLAPAFEEYVKACIMRALTPLREFRLVQKDFRPAWPQAEPDKPLIPRTPTAADTEAEEPPYVSPKYLQDRLNATMMKRWRRICYNRHHAVGLEGQTNKVAASTEPQKTKPKQTLPEKPIIRDLPKPAEHSKQPSKPVLVRKAMSAATVTKAELVVDAQNDLEAPVAKTIVTKVKAGDLNYPLAPKVMKGVELFGCPFCGRPQSTALLDKKQWPVHVMHDLAPYFCILEQCDTPLKTFASSDDWLNHVRIEHSKDFWKCDDCPHHEAAFDTAAAYEEHITTQHVDAGVTAEQISLSVTFATRKKAHSYEECYFCGFVPEAYLQDRQNEDCQKLLIAHMTKMHFKFFALCCLPWDLAGDDGGSSYQATRTGGSGSEEARMEILDDKELEGYFTSKKEQKRLREDPSLAQHKTPAANAIASSLEEIRKRWDSTLKASDAMQAWLDQLDESIAPEEGFPSFDEPSARRPSTAQNVAYEESSDDDSDAGADAKSEESADEEVKNKGLLLTELMDVIMTGDSDKVKDYLHGKEPEDFDYDISLAWDGSAVHTAVHSGNVESVKLLIDARFDQYKILPNIGTPLSLAVQEQKEDMVKLLFEHINDVDRPWYTHANPLALACAVGSKRLAEMLLDRGAGLEAASYFRFDAFESMLAERPKHAYSKHYRPELAVDTPGFISIQAVEGPAIFIAAMYEHIEVVQYLLDKGADPSARTTVHQRWGDNEPSPAEKKDSEISATLLMLCITSGIATLLKLLLDRGANVEAQDSQGLDATSIAASLGEFDCLEALLTALEPLDNKQKVLDRALIHCCDRGATEGAIRLISAGADINATDLDGEFPLSRACLSGRLSAVEMLLERGADRDKLDSWGDGILASACYNGHIEVAKLLISKGVPITVVSKQGCTALLHSMKPESADCLNLLIASGASVKDRDLEGDSSLHYAAVNDRPEHARVLIEHGAEIDLVGEHGRTPLLAAASQGALEIVKLLLEHKADVNAKDTRDGNTALIIASVEGSLDVATVLLQHEAAIETTNNEGRTALFEACVNGRADVAKQLMEHGASLSVEDNNGDTMMLAAVNAGNIQCLQILIEGGATPKAHEQIWEPALFLAAEAGSMACLTIVLEKVGIDTQNNIDATALSLCVENGRHDCAEMLLQKGASAEIADRYGKRPLHVAATQGCQTCMGLLLDHGADINAVDGSGNSPVRLAIDTRPDSLRLLLERGARVDIVDSSNQSLLTAIVRFGSSEEARLLLEFKPDLEAIDAHGMTALMYAASMDLRTKVITLLDAGASYNTRHAESDWTALAYALSTASRDAAEMLLERGAVLDASQLRAQNLYTMDFELRDVMRSPYPVKVARTNAALSRAEIAKRLQELRAEGDMPAVLRYKPFQRLVDLARAAREKTYEATNKKVTFVEDTGSMASSPPSSPQAPSSTASDVAAHEDVAIETVYRPIPSTPPRVATPPGVHGEDARGPEVAALSSFADVVAARVSLEKAVKESPA